MATRRSRAARSERSKREESTAAAARVEPGKKTDSMLTFVYSMILLVVLTGPATEGAGTAK